MKIETKADALYHFDDFVRQIFCSKLKKVCEELKQYEDFWIFPASIGHHHAFESGLIIHTLEVASNAVHTSKIFKEGNDDILITSSLWHDLAKIWDYKFSNNEWQKADYHGKVHHVSGSTAEFTAVAMKNEVDRETIQKIQHCIISHHGIKEWGSPRRPESIEAILLHQADMLSAMYPRHTKIVS